MAKNTLKSIFIENDEVEAFTPTIRFDKQTGICAIEGESCIEDASKFYAQLIDWFELFIAQENKPIELNLKLFYFNTSSSKSILDMLKLLRKYQNSGGQVTVNWYCKAYDTDQLEEAQDYISYTKLPINIITMED